MKLLFCRGIQKSEFLEHPFKIPDESLDMWIKQLEFYYNELMKKKNRIKLILNYLNN